MGAGKVTLECKVTFEKFLKSSSGALAKIEQIDFWNLEEFFLKSAEAFEMLKNALLQCTALKTVCFAYCKLYELDVRGFNALAVLLSQCPKLELLDVRCTLNPLLLDSTPDNTFCGALEKCKNLKWLFFNGNFSKENIDEEFFNRLLYALKKLKKLLNVQYGVHDFQEQHKSALDNINIDYENQEESDSESELKERELEGATPAVLLRNGFLKRLPEQVKTEALHEGTFLLSKIARYTIETEIKAQRRLNNRAHYITIEDSVEDPVDNSVTYHKKSVYINQDYEAFLECDNIFLGEGVYGKVFVVQNVLTGKWHYMKNLAKGALRDSELDILKREGMALSSENLSSKGILIGELIHGKNLKVIINEIEQKKLSLFKQACDRKVDAKEAREIALKESLSFEEALALNISLVEAYESLHRKGYVHRDIKPDNVMFDSKQKKCIAIDFGLSAKVGEESKLGGCYAYAPPEAFLAPPNLKNDIYSIGIIAGKILAFTISNTCLNPYNDQFNHYEKLSLDTLDITSGRYKYLKELCKLARPGKSELKTFIACYFEFFPIIFAAKNAEYQQSKNLSAQVISLCRLIYQMTEPLEDRPDINFVLEEMRKIRLAHIEKRMIHFTSSLEIQYNRVLNGLYESRDKLSNATHALESIDIFLLSAVDVNEKSRPSVESLIQYKGNLNGTLKLKKKLNAEIKGCSLKKPANTPMLETKASGEIQEYFLEKENVNPEPQNNIILYSFKNGGKPASLLTQTLHQGQKRSRAISENQNVTQNNKHRQKKSVEKRKVQVT
jgi:serine/threonine protein kinase